MSIIDVLIAVDGATLAEQVADKSIDPGTESHPTSLQSYQSSDVYVSMVAQKSYVVNDGGKSELTIKANAGDSIRWTITTFGNNIDYTAYLYNGSFKPASNISPLVYLPVSHSTYLPSTGTPDTSTPVLYHNQLYAAQGTVLAPGEGIQYSLAFKLINNYTGALVGYFTWDPFITVSK